MKKENLEYIKEQHPHLLVGDEAKYFVIIGRSINEAFYKRDRINVWNKNKFDVDLYHDTIEQTRGDGKKYVFVFNSPYILKYLYEGMFVMVDNKQVCDFSKYEMYNNYLSIYESESHIKYEETLITNSALEAFVKYIPVSENIECCIQSNTLQVHVSTPKSNELIYLSFYLEDLLAGDVFFKSFDFNGNVDTYLACVSDIELVIKSLKDGIKNGKT